MEVNNPYLIAKLLKALEVLKRAGSVESLIQDLWTKEVNKYIKEILPLNGDRVKELWNTQLKNIKALDSNKKRTVVSAATLHQSGMTFNPLNIMCLFIFGLVSIGEEGKFKFTQLLNKRENAKERVYVADFLSFILRDRGEQEMKVYSSDIAIGDTQESKIHDKLFITDDNHPLTSNTMILDFIPENPWTNLTESLDNEVTITSDPAFWYVYILYDLKDRVDLKCTGLAYKGNYYIFARNLPKYENQAVEELKTTFIDKPFNEYKRVMNGPFPKTNTVMSKVPREYPMLVYVHVMLAALYHPTKDFFVCKNHSTDFDILKAALWAGADVAAYKEKLIHLDGSLTAISLQRTTIDEDVLVRLAKAHYALMSTSTLPFEIVDGTVVYHKQFLSATCEVEDAWVFGGLTSSTKWREELQKLYRAVKTPHEQSALRRMLCYIPDGSAYCKDLCDKFKRKINLGCSVGANRHVVFDFMQHARHNDLLNKTGVTLRDFCASDQYEAITRQYFGNVHVFQPAQLIGLVIVKYEDSTSKRYEVLDISQLEIVSGDIQEDNLRTIDVLPWCPICGQDTPSSAAHFIDKHKESPISFGSIAQDGVTNTVEAFSMPLVAGALNSTVVAVPQPNQANRKQKEGVEFPRLAGVLHKVVGAVEAEDGRKAGGVSDIEKEVNVLHQLEQQKFNALREVVKNDKIKADEKEKELEQQIEALQKDRLSVEGRFKDQISELEREIERRKKDESTSTGEHQKNLDALASEKDALNGQITGLNDTIASLQGEIAQKKTELELANQEIERLKKSASLQATDTDTLKQEKENIDQEIAVLETEKTGLARELAGMKQEMADLATRLKQNLIENKTEESIHKLHTEVEKMIQEEMGLDGLIELLERKEYSEFKARVQQKDAVRHKHSLPAQFLMCESIAATWALFEKPSAGAVSPIMAQKLMHHIHLYDSMEHDARVQRFTSQYFKKFKSKLGYDVPAAIQNGDATAKADENAEDGSANLVPFLVGD